MSGIRDLVAMSASAVYGSGRYFLLYAAVSAAAASSDAGMTRALLWMAGARLMECGLAGVMRDGLEGFRPPSLRGFGANAFRYFPRALVAGLMIAGGCALFVAGTLFVLVMAGSYVPYLPLSIRGMEKAFWSPAVSGAALVLTGAWTLCAISLIIYRGRGIFGALAGSWAVIKGNRELIGVYVAVYAATLFAQDAVPKDSAALYRQVAASASLIMSAMTAFTYAALFVAFRERDGRGACARTAVGEGNP